MHYIKFVTIIQVLYTLIIICTSTCSSSRTGIIKAKIGLNMRTGPFTSKSKILIIPYASVVQIDCWNQGQSIYGNNDWIKVCYGSHIGYVADYYVDCGGGFCKDVQNLPVCSVDPIPSNLACPVKASVMLTSPFGAGRDHIGIDVSNDKQEYIYAAIAGNVSKVVTGKKRYETSYGNVVYIDHVDNVQTRYAHLDNIYVQVGNTVSMGQKIALMGNTGNTVGKTGIHLHFEWRVNDNPINPCLNLSSVCSFC